MKYLSECDLIIYDLHSGNPQDVMLALEALRKYKFEEEKVLILVTSLMAWSGTPRKLEEFKTPEQIAEEQRLAASAAKEAEADAGGEDDEDKPKEDEEEKPVETDEEDGEDKPEESAKEEVKAKAAKLRPKFKHIPFSEKDFAMRDPIEEYKIIK